MSPRLLIFSTAYLPLVGGAEIAIKELSDRLTQFDFDVLTARLDPTLAPVETVGRVTVYRLGRGSWLDKLLLVWRGASVATRLHQQHSYQGIWAMMASYGGLAALSFKRRFRHLPLLLSLQEGDDLREIFWKTLVVRPWWLAIFREATYIQGISRYLAKWARESGAFCPVEVIPNGVDLKKFLNPNPVFPRNSRPEKIVITTSRLVKKNGVADLITALAYLPETVKLWICGDGPLETELRQLADRLAVNGRVSFFGYCATDQMIERLKQADIFARPSRSEGLGNSFLEAMAVGLPVIGTPVGGIPDFLYGEPGRTMDRQQTGWLCGVRDPVDLAQKIGYILDPAHTAEVVQVINRAQALVAEQYNWELIASELRLIWETLLKEKTLAS